MCSKAGGGQWILIILNAAAKLIGREMEMRLGHFILQHGVGGPMIEGCN